MTKKKLQKRKKSNQGAIFIKVTVLLILLILSTFMIKKLTYRQNTTSIVTNAKKKFPTDVENDMETVLSAQDGKNKRFIKVTPTPITILSPIGTVYASNFPTNETLQEANNLTNSTDLNWWLSSGAYFYMSNDIDETNQGNLPTNDTWRIEYSQTNPVDTDNGYHPQNIFRLVNKNQWLNYQQQVYYLINKDNLSSSPRRNGSNGLLLFNRYQDQDNLYYTGIRVDGAVVIKKKMNGIYYTMAYVPFFSGSPYNSNTNPNLLPKNVWIGLKSIVITNPNGTVTIKLYVDKGKTGNWILAASAIDNGISYGGAVINSYGHGGIRTDFMDVEFSNYEVNPL